MISLTVPSPKISTNIQLKKFIATATVSGPSQNHLIAQIRLNQNVINPCQSSGGMAAAHILPRKTQ
jgi:hypothetical protein